MRTIVIHSADKKRRDALATVLKTVPDFSLSVVATTAATISLLSEQKVEILIVDTNHCSDDIAPLLQWCNANRPLLYRILLRDEHLSTTYKSLLSLVHGSLSIPSNGMELKRFVERIANDYPDNTPVPKTSQPEKIVIPLKERITTLLEEIHETHPTQAVLSGLISSDAEIARLIIKRINSPFYGLANRIQSIERAILLMGTESAITCLSDAIAESEEQSTGKVMTAPSAKISA